MWRQRSESKRLAVSREGGACCATAGRTTRARAMPAAAARGAMRMESSGLYCGTPEGSVGIASRRDLLLLLIGDICGPHVPGARYIQGGNSRLSNSDASRGSPMKLSLLALS